MLSNGSTRDSFDRRERRRQVRLEFDGDAGLLAAGTIANRIDDDRARRRRHAELFFEIARDLQGRAVGVEVPYWLPAGTGAGAGCLVHPRTIATTTTMNERAAW